MKFFIIQIIEYLYDKNLPFFPKLKFLVNYFFLILFTQTENGLIKSCGPDNSSFYYLGIHKNVVMDHLITHITSFKNYYNTNSIIIDIGASFGTFPRIANTYYPGVKAYCIEMAQDSFDVLLKNTSSLPNVKCFQLAVGNKSGRVSYHYDSKFPEGAFVSKSESADSVTMTTLDQFITKQHIKKVTLVKIDTEGHELQVLLGATNVLKTADCFIIETGLDPENFAKVSHIMSINRFRLANFGETNYDAVRNRIDSCDLVFQKLLSNEKH
jgi:FkbM family methyltransferase